jgi:hypothetical protein
MTLFSASYGSSVIGPDLRQPDEHGLEIFVGEQEASPRHSRLQAPVNLWPEIWVSVSWESWAQGSALYAA